MNFKCILAGYADPLRARWALTDGLLVLTCEGPRSLERRPWTQGLEGQSTEPLGTGSEDIEHLDEKRQAARSAFDLRYGDTIDPGRGALSGYCDLAPGIYRDAVGYCERAPGTGTWPLECTVPKQAEETHSL